MTSRTPTLRARRVASAGLQPRAIERLARWCASRLARPLYHHLGAFDLARSGLAAELLNGRRPS
ncbi:MAG TPA: hypothetical protein VMG60_04055 [Burkholderiaceae bacterium]|nr:hypothetical protein [Burkholderiaceae bacterium]